MTQEQDFWNGALHQWPDLEPTGIGVDNAEYLSRVGLPAGVDWTLEIPSEQRPEGVPEDYLMLASDGSVPICLTNEGVVVALEPRGERLVNSSARSFGGMLMVYQDYRLRVRGMDADQAAMLVEETALRMRQCDPAVMASQESYWSVVLEQMRSGLL